MDILRSGRFANLCRTGKKTNPGVRDELGGWSASEGRSGVERFRLNGRDRGAARSGSAEADRSARSPMNLLFLLIVLLVPTAMGLTLAVAGLRHDMCLRRGSPYRQRGPEFREHLK